MTDAPRLSIVVPAYNEETRLGATLDRILAWLDEARLPAEILVVDDGSRDGTAALVERRAAAEPRLRLLGGEGNRGKGYAVGRGVAAARGDQILFSDADLSTPIRFHRDLEQALQTADLAIASRALPASRIPKRQPLYRESMGRMFNVLVRTLVLGGIHDTQCGFKLFRAEAARRLFALRRIDGFAFDVEILFLARKLGLRVAEVPVEWNNDEATRVSALRHSSQMFADLLRVRWMHRHAR